MREKVIERSGVTKMTKREEYEALLAKYEVAKQASRANRNVETMTTSRNASLELSQFIAANPAFAPKRSGYASKAGKRQTAERRNS
jgi:predicted DsbA family dithiol-disulfide isomerase